MNKATEKLINYLNETSQRKKEIILDLLTNDDSEKQKEKRSLVRDTTEVICSENIVKILMTDIKDYGKEKTIFMDFKILSKLLADSNLNNREKLSILIEFVEKNISTGILEDAQMESVDILDLDRKKLKLTVNERFNLQDANYVNDLLRKSKQELTEREIEIKEELEKNKKISTESKNMSKIIINSRMIKDHLIDKGTSYITDDIKEVVIAFKNLNVTEDICNCVKYILEKDLEKRITKESAKKPVYDLYIPQEHSKKYLTDKEYRQIKKELRNYFDFYNMKPVRELSQEEIMYCASLALKLNINKDTVRLFFIIMEKQYNNDNPIAQFIQNYNKIKYYEERFELEESVDIINEAIKECFIVSAEDYKVWKEMIKLELDEINKKMPKNYEYELVKASSDIEVTSKVLRK